MSFLDGKRCRQKQWTDISKINDEICRKYQLDVVEGHGRRIPYQLAKAEREGAPTRLNIAREAVDYTLSVSCNLRELKYNLSAMGYICQFDENRKYWTIRQEDWKRPIRLIRMGNEYSNEQIRQRLRNNSPEVRKAVAYSGIRKCHRQSHTMKKSKSRKIGGLRGLYYHYCYLLGYMPKRKIKPYQVSPELRDDLIKLNEISKEVRLLQENHIDDLQQLFDYKRICNGRIFSLQAEIQKLCNLNIRKSTSTLQAIEIKSEIEKLKGELKQSRYEILICNRIILRNMRMKENIMAGQVEKDSEADRNNITR